MSDDHIIRENQLNATIASNNASNFTSAMSTMAQLLDSKIKQLYTVVFGVFFFVCTMEKNIKVEIAIGIISAIIGLGLLAFLAWLNHFITASQRPKGTAPVIRSTFVDTLGRNKLTLISYSTLTVVCVICLIIPPISCIISILTFDPAPGDGFWCKIFPKLVWCQ